jgi:NOL1/NOP2/sun family putative RNA methylase
MKRKSPAETLAKKRTALLERTMLALDIDETKALGLLRIGRQQSIRLNPLAGDPEHTRAELETLGWGGKQFPWVSDGFTMHAGQHAIRGSSLVAEGKVYIQNAASWLPPVLLQPQPGDTILDVCAAPGGKTTHIAALTNNQAQITANDNSRVRLAKLRAVCRQMHAEIAHFTLYDARQLSRKLEGQQFDRILLDAPCSGEGMMQFDHDKDFATWSVAQIKRLQTLQRQVLRQAWELLKPGGTLLYSTCTMAPEENEAVIDYALRAFDGIALVPLEQPLDNRVPAVQTWNGKAYDPRVAGCMRLVPSPEVEAFFVCKLIKQS